MGAHVHISQCMSSPHTRRPLPLFVHSWYGKAAFPPSREGLATTHSCDAQLHTSSIGHVVADIKVLAGVSVGKLKLRGGDGLPHKHLRGHMRNRWTLCGWQHTCTCQWCSMTCAWLNKWDAAGAEFRKHSPHCLILWSQPSACNPCANTRSACTGTTPAVYSPLLPSCAASPQALVSCLLPCKPYARHATCDAADCHHSCTYEQS
jgi:hypothetical protein